MTHALSPLALVAVTAAAWAGALVVSAVIAARRRPSDGPTESGDVLPASPSPRAGWFPSQAAPGGPPAEGPADSATSRPLIDAPEAPRARGPGAGAGDFCAAALAAAGLPAEFCPEFATGHAAGADDVTRRACVSTGRFAAIGELPPPGLGRL